MHMFLHACTPCRSSPQRMSQLLRRGLAAHLWIQSSSVTSAALDIPLNSTLHIPKTLRVTCSESKSKQVFFLFIFLNAGLPHYEGGSNSSTALTREYTVAVLVVHKCTCLRLLCHSELMRKQMYSFVDRTFLNKSRIWFGAKTNILENMNLVIGHVVLAECSLRESCLYCIPKHCPCYGQQLQ